VSGLNFLEPVDKPYTRVRFDEVVGVRLAD